MQLIIYFLFLLSGMISFLTYRLGLTDGIKFSAKEPITPIIRRGGEYSPKENEKEFMSQYSELMNYDFDKVGGSGE